MTVNIFRMVYVLTSRVYYKGSVTIQVGTTFCGKTENPKGGGGVKAKNCAKIRGIQVFSCFSFRLLFHHGRTFIFNRVINLWLNFLI